MEQELFSTANIAAELEHKSKNPNRDVLNIAKRLRFTPVATRPREGKTPGGKPEMLWSREQHDTILADNRNRHKDPAQIDSPVKEPHEVSETTTVDNHEIDSANDSANDTEIDKPATIEPAPAIDTESLIDEPLENKSLEELADEANHYVSCGDECFAQGLTFYLAAGRRLLEAKSRLAHGQWQIWLANNFSASVDTAQNYMKLARRFSSTAKTESIRHLNPTTLIRMLALPEGDEQEFIAAQAEAGNPVEKQSTREVQKSVKQFKQRHAVKKDSDNTEPVDDKPQDTRADVDAEEPPPDLSNIGETFSIFGRETDKVTEAIHDDHPVVSEPVAQDSAKQKETATDDVAQFNVVTHEQLIALRQLVTTTNDLQTLKKIRDSIADVIKLADAKIGELAQKNKPL